MTGRTAGKNAAAHAAQPALAAAVLLAPLLLVLGGQPFGGLPPFIRYPLIGLGIVLCPGAAWVGLGRLLASPVQRTLPWVVLASSAGSVLVLVTGAMLHTPPGPPLAAGVLLAFTALGVIARPQKVPPARPAAPPTAATLDASGIEPAATLAARGPGSQGAPLRLLAAAFCVTLAAATFMALWVVPPLEDHDMEIQGTAYGLATTLRPEVLTNRQGTACYAHPLLLHVFAAAAIAVDGQLEATRHYYDSAVAARAAFDAGRPVDWERAWGATYRAFRDRPVLGATRAPNLVFSALASALLVWFVYGLTDSGVLSCAALLVYLSVPETLVRHAYGGYHAITLVMMLLIAAVYSRGAPSAPDDEASRPLARRLRDLAGTRLEGAGLACGFIAALAEHKTGIVIAAAFAHRLLLGPSGVPRGERMFDGAARRNRPLRGRLASVLSDSSAVSLGGGFVLGYAAWLAYGLSLDAAGFIRDHIQLHVINRFLLNDVRFTAAPGHYSPSIPGVWWEFASHSGWFLLPLAIVGTLLMLSRRAGRFGVLALWAIIGALLFSVTDWRQTKHLMLLLPPLVVGAAGLLASRRRILRLAAAVALAAAVMLNIATDARLVRDFGSLRISGASEYDGW